MRARFIPTLLLSILFLTSKTTIAREQTAYVQDLDSRTAYLEEQVRLLNGKVEELNHSLKVLQQNLGPFTPDGTVVTAPPAGQAKPSAPPATVTPAPVAAETPPPAAPSLPMDEAQTVYDKAVSYLNQAHYSEAEAAFKSFITQFPKDPRAVNAKYWLGETYMMQSKYADAAVAFAEAYEIYKQQNKKATNKNTPKQNLSKAPEALIKLAFALKSMGNTADACATLAQLNREFPQLPHNLLTLTGRVRQGLRCQ